jgi:hypothetical protein
MVLSLSKDRYGMGAKIGFQQKISPFRHGKTIFKIFEGLIKNGEVIKE